MSVLYKDRMTVTQCSFILLLVLEKNTLWVFISNKTILFILFIG